MFIKNHTFHAPEILRNTQYLQKSGLQCMVDATSKSAKLTCIWSQWPHTRIEVVEGEVTWVLWPFAITMHTHIAPILLGKLLKAPSTVTRSVTRDYCKKMWTG